MNSNLLRFGWDDWFQQILEQSENPNLVPARVTRENRGRYIVNTGSGELDAVLPQSFSKNHVESVEYPTVGDWVMLSSIVVDEAVQIDSVLPRKSLMKRQIAGKESKDQLIAANIDTLFLVSGLDADFNIRRIQRYLTLAWNSGAEPVILLNKIDLCDDLDSFVKQVSVVAPGVSIHGISAQDPETLSCLSGYVREGKTVALLGSSGVGKSTLVNAFLGENQLATQENRAGGNRGRHTTTWRELIAVPSDGVLIDLPGMRELQLTDDDEGVKRTFADIELIAKRCRFRNCTHNGEPGCAIEEALNNGQIDLDRYSQWIKLSRESAKASQRKSERAAKRKRPAGKYDDKKDFFKEIGMRRRKQQKANRHIQDGYDL